MRNRTSQPPLILNNSRPIGNAWQWNVSYHVASSGYPTKCHVTAMRHEPGQEELVGTAWCSVSVGDDLREVIECLAIESMLAATEPTLDGSTPTRKIVFSSNL